MIADFLLCRKLYRAAAGCYNKRKNREECPVIKIIARRIIKPDCIEAFEALAAELVRESRKEPGCLGYTLNRSNQDPRIHMFIESWADQAAIEEHNASAHFTRIVPQFAALSEERLPTEIFTELEA